MFEAIATILVTLGAWGYLIVHGIELKRTVEQLRNVRAYAHQPLWFLVQTWWSNRTYTDQLCTIAAVPIAVWGFCFIAATF